MISKLLAMTLVAYDPRKNPAAGLFWSAVGDFGRSVSGLCSGIASCFESSSAQSYAQSYSQSYTAPSTPVERPQVAKVAHCAMPDYAVRLRAAVDGLSKDYFAQKRLVDGTKELIDSHARIDLAQLGCEINGVKDEIGTCQSSSASLDLQRQAYRAEGVWRNVFVHGFAQHSLSRQMANLRDKKASLVAKQAKLEAMVDERNSFDFAANEALLKKQEGDLSAILQQYHAQKALLDNFDLQMKRFVSRVAETVSLINREIDRYNILKEYEAELNAASNSYERFQVHKKCDEMFGDGAVGRLLSRSRSYIRQLSKRYEEQNQVALWHAREIGLQV